jgi:membrane protease YdiL (CAAX protease family)
LPATLALLVVGAGLGLVLSFAVVPSASRGGAFNPANAATLKEIARVFTSLLPKALALAGLLAGIRFVHRKRLGCIFTDGRPFRIRFAVQSAAVWALLWFAGVLVQPQGWEHLARRAGEIPLAWWPVLAVCLLAAGLVAIGLEEVLFRGYLQPRIGAWVKRPWAAVGITALGFTVLHRGGSWAAYAAIGFGAVLFGTAGIRAGTLAPLLGMHATHDTLEVLWHPNDTNAGATWLDAVVWVVGLSIWFGWLLWATRSRPVGAFAQPDGAANPSQPVGADTDRTSAAAGSGG